MNNNKQYRFTLFTNRDVNVERNQNNRRRVFKFLMNFGSRLEQNKQYKLSLESLTGFGVPDDGIVVVRCPNVMGKYFYDNSPESTPIIYAGWVVNFQNSSLDFYSYEVDSNIMMNELTLIIDNEIGNNNNLDNGLRDDCNFALTFILTEYRDE